MRPEATTIVSADSVVEVKFAHVEEAILDAEIDVRADCIANARDGLHRKTAVA